MLLSRVLTRVRAANACVSRPIPLQEQLRPAFFTPASQSPYKSAKTLKENLNILDRASRAAENRSQQESTMAKDADGIKALVEKTVAAYKVVVW